MRTLNQILRHYPKSFILDDDLFLLLPGSNDSRYGKVKRAIAKKELIRIRKGFYVLGEEVRRFGDAIELFELANYMYMPSYVSLESALAYHQLIPEAVYTITSVSTKRKNTFQTPIGMFTYYRLPTENFFSEVTRVTKNNHLFLIATPWKALCDYVFCYKKSWRNLEPVLGSLRIERENLPILSRQTKDNLNKFYKNKRITQFLNGVYRELSNEYRNHTK